MDKKPAPLLPGEPFTLYVLATGLTKQKEKKEKTKREKKKKKTRGFIRKGPFVFQFYMNLCTEDWGPSNTFYWAGLIKVLGPVSSNWIEILSDFGWIWA